MKIARVDVHVLRSSLERPFAYSQGWVRERCTTLVEIETDDGIVGWGEGLCVGLQPPQIAAAVIRSAFAPLLLGADPRETEVMWHRLYTHARDYGMKGSVITALSGVDIALWDIAGKALGVPVHRLLGGAFRRRIEAYATGFYRTTGRGEAARLASEAERHRESGFRIMKVKTGFGIDDDLAVMRAVHAAAGEDATLMIDSNHAYGVADAVRLGRALESMNLRWYEEPVVPEDRKGYAEVRRKLDIPIAGGECEYTGYGFRELLDERAIDIAQPDICQTGGFTACRHIVALCHVHGVQVNPHVWGSAVGQAASVQLLAAVPLAHPSLYATEPILEYDCSAHPFRSDLVRQPVVQHGGWVEVPDRPGIGVEIDRAVLQRFRVNA